MVELNLNYLNKIVPYKISKLNFEGSYGFMTDHGIEYVITFMLDYSLESDFVYQFVITNFKHPHSQKDSNVRVTIIELLRNFFELNNNTIIYFCDTSDNRQMQRDRLFKRWIDSAEHTEGMLTVDGKIKDENGNENFVTLLSRSDNPNFMAVVEEFKDLLNTLKNKPN